MVFLLGILASTDSRDSRKFELGGSDLCSCVDWGDAIFRLHGTEDICWSGDGGGREEGAFQMIGVTQRFF